MTEPETKLFRILYENPHAPVTVPEPYEGYDVESAFYDYLPSNARAAVALDGYRLELPGVKMVFWVRKSLTVAERLATLDGDPSEDRQRDFPELPPGAKICSILFADFLSWFPVLVFARKGDKAWLYTRTASENAPFSLVVLPERDRAAPIVTTARKVIDEICTFLTAYLDDVAAAFPFIAADEKYQTYRQRIAALSV